MPLPLGQPGMSQSPHTCPATCCTRYVVCLAIARRYFTHFNVILAHANRIFSVR